MTFGIMTLGIMTLSITRLSIMTAIMLNFVVLSVVMLNVVAPHNPYYNITYSQLYFSVYYQQRLTSLLRYYLFMGESPPLFVTKMALTD